MTFAVGYHRSARYRIQLLLYLLYEIIFRPLQDSSQAVHQLPHIALMRRAPRSDILHMDRLPMFEMHPQLMYWALGRDRETEPRGC